MARLRLRIQFTGNHTLGPGKIQLLEAVGEYGSISAAARSMKMSYRHAWEMLDDINQCFRQPAVETEPRGRSGGSHLTPFGREVIERFHAMQVKAHAVLQGDLDALNSACVDARVNE